MANAARVTCPRCGAPLPADGPAGRCPRCHLSDTQGDKTEIPPASPSASGRAFGKLALASAVAAFAAILLGGSGPGTCASSRPTPTPSSSAARTYIARGSWGGDRGIPAAIRIKPDLAEAHHHLGVALVAQGKPEEAIAAYRAAIQIKPEYARAHNNLGATLQAVGKLDEAVAAFRTAIRLEPETAEAHCNLGITLRCTGNRNRRSPNIARQSGSILTSPSLTTTLPMPWQAAGSWRRRPLNIAQRAC